MGYTYVVGVDFGYGESTFVLIEKDRKGNYKVLSVERTPSN